MLEKVVLRGIHYKNQTPPCQGYGLGNNMASINKFFFSRLVVMIWVCFAVFVALPWFVPGLALLGLVIFSIGVQEDGRPSNTSLLVIGMSVALGVVSFLARAKDPALAIGVI